MAAGSALTLAPYGLVWFTYFANVGLFNPYSPLWFKELGFSTLAIGALSSLQAWTRVFAPYGWGWLGDHGGRRVHLLRLAALGSVLAACGLLIARGYGAVALCVAFLFVANGGIVPLSEATLAQVLSTERGMDTTRYGRVRMWGSIGFIVAVTLSGVLLQTLGIAAFPWLVVLMWGLLLVATLRLSTRRDSVHAAGTGPRVWPVLRQPGVAWTFAAVFFTVLAHTSLYAFFSLYLDQQGFDKSAVGALWAVAVAVEIAFFWFQGRWFARLSPRAWLELAAAVSIVRFAAIAAFGSWVMVLVAAQLLHALTFAAQHAACITLVHRHFPGALRGRGQALYTVLGYGASGVVGGVGGGALIGTYGYEAVFWAAAAAATLGWFCARQARA
jgi:MFS transporter, PPP family, 3-phenylpropionic acid transporter